MFMKRVLRLITCFQELGREINLTTLSSRKIYQKITYFIQEFGLNLNYTFNWYIYGPYSPELTREAFEIYSIGDPLSLFKEELPKLKRNEKKILCKVKTFLEEVDKLSRNKEQEYWIELLSSVHYLYKYAFPKAKSLEETWKILNRFKPDRFQMNDVRRALDFLKEHGL